MTEDSLDLVVNALAQEVGKGSSKNLPLPLAYLLLRLSGERHI